MQCVAITGANGYVGSAIASYFHTKGWNILELGRRKNNPNAHHIFFELGAELPSLDWQSVNTLVHCAHDFRPLSWSAMERINVKGGIRLLEAAAAHGVGGVLISSLSSFEGCRSLYGKAKFTLEQEAIRLGFSVIRPGLVWGEYQGSMMATLERLVQLSPIIPLIGDGSFPQYLVHKDDLAHVIYHLCQSDQLPLLSPLSAAAAEKIPFRKLLLHLAAQQGRTPICLPLPSPVLLWALRILEAFRIPIPFRSDSLMGIVHQNPRPNFLAAQKLGFSFRRFI